MAVGSPERPKYAEFVTVGTLATNCSQSDVGGYSGGTRDAPILSKKNQLWLWCLSHARLWTVDVFLTVPISAIAGQDTGKELKVAEL